MAAANISCTLTNRWVTMVTTMVIFFLASCSVPSLSSYGDDAIRRGATVSDAKKRYGADPKVWQKPSYSLPNGNVVYIEPAGGEYYVGCDYHWEVDSEGHVVGYSTVGSSCKKHGGIQGWRRWTGTGIEQFPEQ